MITPYASYKDYEESQGINEICPECQCILKVYNVHEEATGRITQEAECLGCGYTEA